MREREEIPAPLAVPFFPSLIIPSSGTCSTARCGRPGTIHARFNNRSFTLCHSCHDTFTRGLMDYVARKRKSRLTDGGAAFLVPFAYVFIALALIVLLR